MTANSYSIIGLMSGTSLDGLDLAHCEFTNQDKLWNFDLKHYCTISYSPKWKSRLKDSINLPAPELLQLNNEYGKWLGEQVNELINEKSIELDFVSSHGHTVFHQPDKKLTYQIGAGQEIANACSKQVICDFRSLDISLGGQGAPLVPIGDRLLFSTYDYCLNLGGIANISFELANQRIAYDIAPANMLLNYLANKIGKEWDNEGDLARSGKLNSNLLDQLNSLNYYQLKYPKSLGYEWFKDEVIPIMDNSELSIADKLCTSVHHIAQQVVKEIENINSESPTMIITGGGAKNGYLVECIRNYSRGAFEVKIPLSSIIDYKEAIVFGFLGVLRLRGEINCLRSVTGAKRDTSGGVIFEPCR